MPVKAVTADYHGDFQDTVDKYHGQQLISLCWEKHTMFGWPMCLPVPPDMPFGGLIEKVIPSIFSDHPDFARIDWSAVQWSTSKGPFTPDPAKSLKENGIGHKQQIRFRTPGLDGYNGAG
ncbi:phenol hydroxylase subunit P4 [Panacagrimonas sp.]|uniref:phenol hydroxylase subunit P4 n=1 Tax=Panacagrimonas sp. TaxID=2480088 RepID=UPI003B51AF61